jgi:tyrosine-protein phosphatase YwqE
MWPFSKKISLNEQHLLTAWTDHHTHLLYGVDDGVKTIDESLTTLTEYENLGIQEIWCTPHIMEDIPNTTEILINRFNELKQAYSGKIKLHLAAEYMIDNLFSERLDNKDLLPIAGVNLLVETSYYNPPLDFEFTIKRVKSLGFHPLLAHPERYRYMTQDYYLKLKKEFNVKFQLNLASLFGLYGQSAKNNAEWLLKQNLYNVAGSDMHNVLILKKIGESTFSTDTIKRLTELLQKKL